MKTMYLVKYTTGSYENEETTYVFCTSKKSTATKYCTRFNKLFDKWYKYYKKYESVGGLCWMKEEYGKKYYLRWYYLRRTNRCYWEQIEIR